MRKEKKIPFAPVLQKVKSLLKGEQKVPKLLYVVPLLFWGAGYATSITVPGSTGNKIVLGAKIKNIPPVSLQDDINYISEQGGDRTGLDKSKKEIIKEEAKQNFLMQTIEKQMERSVWAKSVGSEDNTGPGEENIKQDIPEKGLDSTQVQAELNYAMNTYKYDDDRRQVMEQKAKEETQRMEQMEAGREENRKRREAVEAESTLVAEAEAYRKGAEDYANITKSFSIEGEEHPGKDKNHNKQNTKQKQIPGLSFNTRTGSKDELKSGERKTEETLLLEMIAASLQAQPAQDSIPEFQGTRDAIPQLVPGATVLKGTIDEGVTLKAGDKVQIRITKSGVYRGRKIPVNTILYGLCSISGNRVKIKVPSIRYGNELLQSSLQVYDTDGLQGIYVDGFYNDFTKGIIDESIQQGTKLGIKFPFSDMSLKLGRKANNRASAYIPAGYAVWLHDGREERKGFDFANFQKAGE